VKSGERNNIFPSQNKDGESLLTAMRNLYSVFNDNAIQSSIDELQVGVKTLLSGCQSILAFSKDTEISIQLKNYAMDYDMLYISLEM
jgi:hypothetical protein